MKMLAITIYTREDFKWDTFFFFTPMFIAQKKVKHFTYNKISLNLKLSIEIPSYFYIQTSHQFVWDVRVV